MTSNLLYYGAKLDILRRDVKDERVDLVCLGLPLKRDRTATSSSADRHSYLSAGRQVWTQGKTLPDGGPWLPKDREARVIAYPARPARD